jgi:hypothetical protein
MWVGHVAHMREREMHTTFWRENMREADHMGDLSIDGKMLLRWILKK